MPRPSICKALTPQPYRGIAHGMDLLLPNYLSFTGWAYFVLIALLISEVNLTFGITMVTAV